MFILLYANDIRLAWDASTGHLIAKPVLKANKFANLHISDNDNLLICSVLEPKFKLSRGRTKLTA